MPGTIIFKPIEANLTHNTDLLTKMNPYCSVIVGTSRVKGQICKKGGKHPHWNEAITVPASNVPTAVLEVMDKDKITSDDHVGSCLIDLQEIQAMGHVHKWYPLTYKNKPAGEILLEVDFQTGPSLMGQGQTIGEQIGMSQGLSQGNLYDRQEQTRTFQGEQIGLNQGMSQGSLYQKEDFVSTQPSLVQEERFMNQGLGVQQEAQVFAEQRQYVEPHTFTKQVDVVETRPVLQEVEVLEPHKVVKDVQVTEAVPVKKQIEVVEPQVVTKEVEVMEPRVVTKEIKVVENVPVMKEVEVIESKTVLKEVDTLEPRTFTKQVEVTEHMPVKKQVEVTEPVTVKKAVEFVEPIITTKTITKEVQPTVVVDEKIETTVGPATITGIETKVNEGVFVNKTSDVRISEQERLWEEERLRQDNLRYQSGEYSSTLQKDQQESFGGNKMREPLPPQP